MESLSYPRAKAYSLCGLYEMLRAGIDADEFESVFVSRRDAVKDVDSFINKDTLESIFINHANSLVDLYEKNHKEGWSWFESTVTYGNAKLSESLLLAYNYTKDRTYRKIGLTTLDFLTEIQWRGNFFDLVGNHGWYSYNGQKPIFDQQPIDAGYLTQAYVSAYEIVRDKRYLELAKYSFEYFLGRNRLKAVMYDYSTGAVCDGLNPDGINCNQGAESVICFLMALSSLKKHMDGTVSTAFQSRVSDGVVSDGVVSDGVVDDGVVDDGVVDDKVMKEKGSAIFKSGGVREIK
jgi:hypothetical protein